MNSKVELRIGAQAVHVIGRTAVLARLVQGVGVACLSAILQALNGLGAGKSRQREQRQGPDSHHGDGVAL
jgi:hypothetical protein